MWVKGGKKYRFYKIRQFLIPDLPLSLATQNLQSVGKYEIY